MSSWGLCLCLLIFIGSGLASDVPFNLGKNTSDLSSYSSIQLKETSTFSSDLIGVPIVTLPSDNETLEIPITGATGGESTPEGKSEKVVRDLKDTMNKLVETDNPEIHDAAAMCASKHPGDLRIEQICDIYYYLKFGDDNTERWKYVRDPRGIDSWNYASHSMKIGKEVNPPCVGIGDCDDFAILMATFVESIGGATRIILANNNSIGGHAYCEVYIGQLNIANKQIENIISWLKNECFTDKIYGHIDTDTKEVWLNLDWGGDERGNAHPGGPLFKGDKNYVIRVKDKYKQIPVKTPEAPNKPPRLISLTSDINSPQEAGSVVTWTAKAVDVDNDTIVYRFFLNGYPVTNWIYGCSWTWTTAEADIGDNEIEAQLRDGKHAGPNGFDGRKRAQFEVNKVPSPDQKLIIKSAKSSKASPNGSSNFSGNVSTLDNKSYYTLLNNKIYQGESGKSYRIIGVQRAWDLIQSSNITFSKVRVGVISDGLYDGYGEFDKAEIDTSIKIGDSPSLLESPAPGYEHIGSSGTAFMNILAADADNRGLVGIASLLSPKGMLKIYMINMFDSDRMLVPISLQGFQAIKELTADGCTIICCPWGNSNADADEVEMYQEWFEKALTYRPEVLFICCAGNNGWSVDGNHQIPNGLPAGPLPNVITVGSITNDGRRTTSNMNSDNFEVTLAAPGQQVPFALDYNGSVLNRSGSTLFAAAEVAAAAALIRSINSSLTAGEIKEILVSTGRTTIDGKPVPNELGGRVLAIDEAVKKAMDGKSRKYLTASNNESQV